MRQRVVGRPCLFAGYSSTARAMTAHAGFR